MFDFLFVVDMFVYLFLDSPVVFTQLDAILYLLICLGPDPKPVLKGENRTYRVHLDCNQYQEDMVEISNGREVSYVLVIAA